MPLGNDTTKVAGATPATAEPAKLSRREFGQRVGAVAAASALAGIAVPAVHAAGDSVIQVALVGCGGRGTGAAADALKAKGVRAKLIAMADVFKDRLDGSYTGLSGDGALAGKLDTAAVDERRDPTRLLRFYAAALHARDWSAAARAWGVSSGVTAATLKASYDRDGAPVLEIGKGQQEGAAGSLYYEAPVVLRFGKAPPE